MSKVALGPLTLVYPMPAMLVGADVDAKPNFMAVTWGGIACGDPPLISVAVRHVRHTLKGIRQNQTFSVNIPSIALVKETDYCGMVRVPRPTRCVPLASRSSMESSATRR